MLVLVFCEFVPEHARFEVPEMALSRQRSFSYLEVYCLAASVNDC